MRMAEVNRIWTPFERLDEALAEVNAHLAKRRDEGYFRSLRQAGKRESGDKV